MYSSSALPVVLALLSPYMTVNAQNSQAADGAIVPFTSALPACASNCGVLYDVQGKCTVSGTDASCFCSDARLTSFATGSAGVTQACGSATGMCTAATDLQTMATWYTNFCATKKVATTTAGTAGATATGKTTSSTGTTSSSTNSSASSKNQTWLQSHVKWVIMLVILVVVIVGGWIAACFFRRRYLKRKEREFELRPPVVAWGPHQHQSSTGGYSYGDGVVNANGRPMGRGTPRAAETGQLGGHHKEMRAEATPAISGKEESGRGWLKKSRR